jgi:predicted nucleic acid-binding protein
MAAILIQDACVLINLLGSGRFRDIAAGCGLEFAIVSTVSRETLYLHSLDPSVREQIDLQPLVKDGILKILDPENEQEKLRYIELALSLDDGEAESIAIAESRNCALATDDKKARRVIQNEKIKIEIWSTCSLLQLWQKKCSISDADMKNVLQNIVARARYHPKTGHPDYNWWASLFS